MTTVTEEQKSYTTKTLDALAFDAKLVPVYDHKGKELEGFKRVYREDRDATLSIVSNSYQLIQHKEAMHPAVEALGREGWKVNASRIERFGTTAFVELQRRDKVATIVGEPVGERLMLVNSYDRSTSLRLSVGVLVLRCTNGAVAPGAGFDFSAPHTGDGKERVEDMLKRLGRIERDFGSRIGDYYSKLDKAVPDEIAREIIKRSLGERRIDTIERYWTGGIGRDGAKTGWALYNGVTQYLTHDFKGNWGRRESMNEASLQLIEQYSVNGMLPKEADHE